METALSIRLTASLATGTGNLWTATSNLGYAQYEPLLRSLNLHYFFTVDATVAATIGSKLKVLFLLGLFIKAPADDDHCTISAGLSVKRQSLQSSVHHHQYEQRHFAKERCEVVEEVESEERIDRNRGGGQKGRHKRPQYNQTAVRIHSPHVLNATVGNFSVMIGSS